jgi:hypothetical protein
MSRAHRLNVPERHQIALTSLDHLADDAVQHLVRTLTSLPESASRADLVAAVGEAVPEVKEGAADLIDALVTLELVGEAYDWDINDLAESAAHADPLRERSDEPSRLIGHLASLLRVSSIVKNAKAYDLSTAHERVLHSMRILTDLRPAFGDDDLPASAVISHSLQLRYVADGQIRETYLTVNDEDLVDLQRHAGRALRRSERMRDVAEKAGLAIQNVEKDT